MLAGAVFALSLLAATHAVATAQTAPAPHVTPASASAASDGATLDLETGGSYETLSHGRGHWSSESLLLTRRSVDGHVAYAQLLNTNRFSQTDQQVTLGGYVPLAPRWTGFVEAAVSPAHLILPHIALAAGGQYASGGGLFEGVTVRHTEFNTQSVNAALVSVEGYWKQFRGYYALTAARLNGTGTDVEHTFAFGIYYGSSGTDNTTVTYVVGREVENDGAPTLLVSHVNDWLLSGRQRVGNRTALHYGFGVAVQGASYTRTEGFLGLDYRF